MKSVAGKLTNKDSGQALNFSLNPVEYKLNRSFDFAVEPCIGQSAPVVSFRSGGASQLSFQLIFDKDADGECDIKNVVTFVQALNKVDEAKKSVPLLEFTLGSFVFKGYTTSVGFNPGRFDQQGEITQLKLDFGMLSNGEYENGK